MEKERLIDRIKKWKPLGPGEKTDEVHIDRGNQGHTLTSMQINQEALQTALAKARERSATSNFRYAKLKLHGKGSLAYSSLQAGMSYYMNDIGFVAYKQLPDSANSVIVLADPICPTERKKEFLTSFMEKKSDPVWIHITHETASMLAERGFTVNELGVETIIDIQDFDLVGNKKQQLRQARNNGKKDGLTVEELDSVDKPLMRAFKKISDDWLKEKVTGDSEMRFIVRPLIYVDEVDVRKFVAKKDGEIVGFVVFDPMYENNEVIGYIANHLRSNLRRSYSVVDFIILEAMDKFKAEGKKELSLGLSPLAKVDDSEEFKHSKLLKAHFRYCFEKANFLYNFKNLAQHKMKYRPGTTGAREEKIYCAMKTRILLIRMHDVYKVLGFKGPVVKAIAHYKKEGADWLKSKFKKRLDDQKSAAPAAETPKA